VTSFRIQILSDLHAELDPDDLPSSTQIDTGADVVVAAGDMASAPLSIDVACALFPNTSVLVTIAGNHEHYGTGLLIPEGLAVMRASAQHASDQQGRDVFVLENDERVVVVRGASVRFLGCTLWTDYALLGEPEDYGPRAHSLMSDGRRIRGAQSDRFYSPGFVTFTELLEQNMASVAFLEEALSRPYDGPTVVVTHHLPSTRSIDPHYKGAVNAAFASNLDRLVELGAALWVHGHTHSSVEWRDPKGGSLVICNPAGYARGFGRRENHEFQPRMVVGISRNATGKWVAEVETAATRSPST